MKNYEKEYTQALERAKEMLVYKEVRQEDMEYLFPELKEKKSDDKRMKKAIKHILYENYTDAAVIEGVEIAEIVTWLEKQGFNKEQTNLPCFTFDDVLALQCCMETVKKVQEDKELYEKLNDLHSKVYDAYQLKKQGEQKQTWKPSAAQLIVIKDLIEDKNTSNVNKVILQGMFDEFKQFTNNCKRETDNYETEDSSKT